MADPNPGNGPARVVPAEIPGLQALLTVVVAVVTVGALYFGREVLVPITLAVLLSFVLAPVVDLLQRLWLGRVPAVLLAMLLALGGLLFIGGLIGTQIASLTNDVPRYAATIEQKAATVRGFAVTRLSSIMARLNTEMEHATAAAPTPGTPAADRAAGAPPPVPVEVREPDPSPFELAQKVIEPVLGPLATTGIVFVVAIFILLQRQDLRDRLIRLAGSTDLHRTTAALNDAARRLSRFFLAQLGINAAFGCLIAAGLYAIGVPSPFLWGIIAALLRFVPYIGAPLAAVFPIALAAAVDSGWSMVVYSAALFLVSELLTGQVVEPMVYGHSTGLSPVSVVVAAIFWGWIWGPVGLIFSTPLTLCLVVLGRHVERLEFLEVLLGDRPALTPAENFYQRMLAEDPDEALAQAELLLKDRSLSSYYDSVALRGLELAAIDVARGLLTPNRLERVREAVTSVVDDLASHDDVDPPPPKALEGPSAPSLAEQAVPTQPAPDRATPKADDLAPAWRAEHPILCVAGRGPLDEAAAAMLAQLLGKHGLGARVVPHDTVLRGKVGQLDVTGVAMVCISYIELSGSPAHLRYLLRRIRLRLPDVPVLVGLWPSEEAILSNQALQSELGATHYSSSLREAVNSCLEVAHADGAVVQERAAAAAAHAAKVAEVSQG